MASFAWISHHQDFWTRCSENECHLIKLYRRDPTEGAREHRHDAALRAAVVRSRWPVASSPAVCHALFLINLSAATCRQHWTYTDCRDPRGTEMNISRVMSTQGMLQWWNTAQRCRGRSAIAIPPVSFKNTFRYQHESSELWPSTSEETLLGNKKNDRGNLLSEILVLFLYMDTVHIYIQTSETMSNLLASLWWSYTGARFPCKSIKKVMLISYDETFPIWWEWHWGSLNLTWWV